MTWYYVGGTAVATIGGALIASDSARSAANSQADASAAGIAEQRRQANQAYTDQSPYRQAGASALGQLQGEIGQQPTAAQVMSDPGYQFGLQQGQQALNRQAAAAGGFVSGASLKAASDYATNYATTGYGAAYQRRQDRLNRLSALAGIGQTSTNASGAAGAASANAISGIIGSQGDARAAGQLAQGNIWQSAGNQLGAIGQRWASQPQSYAGFNGNAQTGYTNQNPQLVGPPVG